MTGLRPFFNPPSVGDFTLAATQVNKTIGFTSVDGIFVTSPHVRVYSGYRGDSKRSLVAEYGLGDGLALSGNNVAGEPKTLTLTLQGSLVGGLDFSSTLVGECELFGVGDVDVIFRVISR